MSTPNDVADRFLHEERTHSGPRMDPVDRARFHRIVRLCAELWTRHAHTGMRISRGKQGISLLFDGPIGGRSLALFTLRVDYRKGEYRFSGPNADRERMGLTPEALETLERLRDLYAALLVAGGSTDLSVTATLKGKPFPDLLPLVEETRRVLDGGGDASSSRSGGGRSRARKRSDKKPPAVAPAAGRPGKPAGTPSSGATEAVVTEIILTCPEPKDSAAFFRRIFGVKSEALTGPQDHAVYSMGGVRVVLRKDLSAEERRQLGYGSLKRHRGWGLAVAIEVGDWEACLRRVKRVPNALVHEDAEARRMLVRDPSGYVLEVRSAS